MAAGISFTVAVLLGPRWIAWLRRRFREPIKSDSAEIVRLHRDKQSTPTMGGLFIIAALFASVAAVRRSCKTATSCAAMVVAGGMTLVGIVDDLVKIRTAANGISASRQIWPAHLSSRASRRVLLYQQQAAVPDGLSLRVPMLANVVFARTVVHSAGDVRHCRAHRTL